MGSAVYLQAGFAAFLDKPFRLEHIYACLEGLLGVQYEYAPPEEELVEGVERFEPQFDQPPGRVYLAMNDERYPEDHQV